MKVYQTENGARIEVVCNHPDDGSRFYLFVVEQDEEETVRMSVEEINHEIRRKVEEKVNPYGYWHEVEITLVYAFGEKIFREKI